MAFLYFISINPRPWFSFPFHTVDYSLLPRYNAFIFHPEEVTIMGVGAFLEPLTVIVLLFGGTWINRTTGSFPTRRTRRRSSIPSRGASPDATDSGLSTPTAKDGLLSRRLSSSSSALLQDGQSRWRKRQLGFFSSTFEVTSPNTIVFQDRLLSRLLRKFPFLVECWYWALVYWV